MCTLRTSYNKVEREREYDGQGERRVHQLAILKSLKQKTTCKYEHLQPKNSNTMCKEKIKKKL